MLEVEPRCWVQLPSPRTAPFTPGGCATRTFPGASKIIKTNEGMWVTDLSEATLKAVQTQGSKASQTVGVNCLGSQQCFPKHATNGTETILEKAGRSCTLVLGYLLLTISHLGF